MVLHYYNHTLWYGSILVYALLYSIIANSYYVLIIFVHKYWIYWQKLTRNVGILKRVNHFSNANWMRYSQSIFFSPISPQNYWVRYSHRKVLQLDGGGSWSTCNQLKFEISSKHPKRQEFISRGRTNQHSYPVFWTAIYSSILLEIFSSVNSSKSFQRYI